MRDRSRTRSGHSSRPATAKRAALRRRPGRPSLKRMDRAERAGIWAGWLLAPLTGTLSLLRRARMFHPEGAVYRARVEVVPGPHAMLARRLEGPALARLSTAWWRAGKEWLDALGIALRLGRDPGAEAPGRSGPALRHHPLSVDDAVRAADHRAARFPRQRLLRGVALRGGGSGPGEAAPRLFAAAQASRPRPGGPARGGGGSRRGLAAARAADRKALGAGGTHRPARAGTDRPGAAALLAVPGREGDLSRGFVHGLRRATYLLSQVARPQRST